MALDKEKKSNRLLGSRRYTHDSFTDAQEAFTSTLDIQASEVYVQSNLIPTSSLPFSGSSQGGEVYTANGDNIIKYWYRQKLTKSNTNNEVWFFLRDYDGDSGIGAQVITGSQQTNFVSPKYAIPTLGNTQTEHGSAPGYLVKLFKSTQSDVNNVTDSDVVSGNDYTFDYKTGVVQFSANTPTDSHYVYMTAYQYVGKTLDNGLMNQSTNFISGSSISTGSFGHLNVSGNVNVNGNAVIGGNLTFGDADTDSVKFSSDISSSIVPDATGTYSLGTEPKRWRDLYLSGSISASSHLDLSGSAKINGRVLIGNDTATGTDNNNFAYKHDFGVVSGREMGVARLLIGRGNLSTLERNTIQYQSNVHLFRSGSGTEFMRIVGASGLHGGVTGAKVGIGTDNPYNNIHINQPANANHYPGIVLSKAGGPHIALRTTSTSGHGALLALFPKSSVTTANGGSDGNQQTGSFELATRRLETTFTRVGEGNLIFRGRAGNAVQNYMTMVSSSGTVEVHTPLTVSGSIVSTGDIIAQRYIVSSSVSVITSSFSSGSTIFGDTIDDTHRFSGSIYTSGSIFSNGFGVISSSAMIASEISGAFTAISKSFRDDNFVQSQSVGARLANVEGGSVGGGSVSGTNSGDVALIGSLDYLTISGQQITRNAIDLVTDVTGSFSSLHLKGSTAATAISGAFTADSASFSSRITSDSQSFASRLDSVTVDAVTGVTAGTGLTGGGSTGDLTLDVDFTDATLKQNISGSFTKDSASLASRITTNRGLVSGSFTALSASISDRFSSGLGAGASELNIISTGSAVANLVFVSSSFSPEDVRASGSLMQPSTNRKLPKYNFETSTLSNITLLDATASFAVSASVMNDGNEGTHPLLMYQPTYTDTAGRTTNASFIQPIESQNTQIPKFNIYHEILSARQISGSFIGALGTNIITAISGAFTKDSSSFSTRITPLETTSSILAGTGLVQAVGTKSSPTFAGLKVDGDLLATRYIVSSSVSYITSSFSSGSTIFGDTKDDFHRFTGSLNISGSIIANGLSVISSSAMIASEISGAFTAPSNSIDNRIETVSGSIDTRLEAVSHSLQDRISVEHNNRIVFANTSKKLRNDQYTPAVVDHADGSKAALQLQSPGSGTSMTLWVTGSSNWFIKSGVGILTTPVNPSNMKNMVFGNATGTPAPTSQNNLAVGHYSYGGNNYIQGTYNASFGNYALYEARSISHNTAIGYGTGQELLSGSFNTFVGLGAGGQLDGGGNLGAASKASSSYNTMLGAYAGYYYRADRDHYNESLITNSVSFRSGSKSVYVGYGVRPGQVNPQYETVIGPFTSGHGSYTSTIGTGSLYVSTLGDGDVYAGTFTGSAVIVSGNVSGSSVSTGSFGRLEVNTGKVNGDFHITDDLVVTDDAQIGGVFSATGNTILGNAQSDTHTFTGHITASGDISASGTIYASKFESAGESNEVISFNDNLNITGNITSSGDISGSVISTGSFGTINIAGDWTNTGNTVADLGNITTVDINGGTIDNTTIATSNITVGNSKTLDVSAGTLTLANDQISGDKVEGGTIASTTITTLTSNHITASGHISGSSISTGSFGAVSIVGMSVPNVVDVSASLAARVNEVQTSVITGVTSSIGLTGSADYGPVTMSINFADTEFATRISGSFTKPSASFSTRVTDLKTDSGSFSTRVTDVKTRVTVVEGSGYAQGVGTGNSPEFENLTLRGTLRAKEFIVSSSVTHMTQSFSSGSTIFGDSTDDTHKFTGSLDVTGSFNITGALTSNGLGLISSSAQIADEISGSLGANAATIRTLTKDGISGSFTATSHSLQSRITAVEINLDDDMPFAGDSGTGTLDFDTETFTIAGGTNATTVANDGSSTITINVDDAFLVNDADDTTSGKITAGGFNTAGHVTASGNISGSSVTTASLAHVQIPDNGQLSIGDADDLILYHDGSNSYIKDAGTGGLFYRGGTQTFQNGGGTKTMMVLNAATSVDLNYNNSKKFETSPLGVNVTGRLYTSSHITGSGNLEVSGNISGSSTSTGSFGRVEVEDNVSVTGDLSSGKVTVDNIELDGNSITVGSGDLAFNIAGLDIDFNSSNLIDGGDIISTKANAQISGSSTSTGSFGRLEMGGNLVPKLHNTSDLGSSSNRWANIYSADLQLSNEDNDVGNEIDGTKGSWTIQEGEDDLYLLNRKNGKKYRFKLEEIT